MQRINENTYIDDSLVTCAEYQLFIDEMREQGKYYQPDHWVSYQFPKGQSREPILGVRHADAVAFCEWLSNQTMEEWVFRLPVLEEANFLPVKNLGDKSLGYWLNNANEFAWIRPIPENAQELAAALARDRNIGKDYRLANAIAAALSNNLDLDRVIDHIREGNIDNATALIHALDNIRDRARIFDRDSDLALALALDRDSARESARKTDSDVNLVLDIYTALFILQKRIVKRFPAFEGIRLVKERMP